MLRIVCLGDYRVRYSYFTAGIMEGCIRLGHYFRPIEIFQTNLKEILGQIEYFKPHVIFAHQVFNKQYDPDELKNFLKHLKIDLEIKILLHEGDPKLEPRFKEDISQYVDVGLINSSMTKEYSDIWNIPCYHWPYYCLSQGEIQQPQNEFLSDLAFSGNITPREDIKHVHYNRVNFLGEIDKHIKVTVYPNEEIKNSRFLTPWVSPSAKAVIGIHQGYDIPGYVDTRPFQYIGTGALYFHDKCDAIEQYFNDGIHYIGYERKSVKSFLEKYKYYVVDRPDIGQEIRRTGFNNCQKEHNVTVRVTQALEWLKDK